MRVWLGEWVTDSGAARLGSYIWVETLSQLESSVRAWASGSKKQFKKQARGQNTLKDGAEARTKT